MKINAAVSLLDLAPPAASAPSDGGAAGRDFEVAVRDVAGKANDRGGATAGPRSEAERIAHGHKEKSPAASGSTSDGQAEDDADEEAAADGAASSTTADLLGRLLAAANLSVGAKGQAARDDRNGEAAVTAAAGTRADAAAATTVGDAEAVAAAVLAAAAAAEGTTFDGALEERLVITPLGAGSAEGKAPGKNAGRAGVGLEVLHMETHFEPRVDDVVLVEGAARSEDAGAATKDALGGVLSTIRLATEGASRTADRTRATNEAQASSARFDETLARLAAGEGGSAGEGGEAPDRKGSRDGRRLEAKGTDDGRAAGASARTETRGDDAETGSVPAAGSMTSQIADRIVDAFRPASGGERAADLPSGQTHLRMTAGGAALKTLTIQLQPENLGTLDVSMRLVDGRLTLELAASSAETAAALGHDRAGLKKLLEHAGFSMDEASIVIVARDSVGGLSKSASSDANGQAAQGQSQNPSSDARGGSGTGSGTGSGSGSAPGERGTARDSGSDGRQSASGRRNPGEADPNASARRQGSVFL